MGKHFVCEYCGNTVYKQRNDKYKYCSRSCSHNARFGEVIQGDIPSARNPLILEAIKLCQTGLNKVEAAKSVGIKQHILNDWYYKYGAKDSAAIFSNRVCCYCGKSLEGMTQISKRKYCGQSCATKARYLRKHPNPIFIRYDPKLRAQALDLYYRGLEGSIIARHLGVVEGTVYSWIHDFGHLRKRRLDPEIMKLLPVNLRIKTVKSTDEWREILRDNAPDGENTKVCLVCGNFDGGGELNYLVTQVLDFLKCDPCDGRIYAFCNLTGQQISTIQFMNGAFCFTKQPKIKGTYIWPDRSVDLQFEVPKNEFEYLLSLSKKCGQKPSFA